jgi:hypothetical protein
MAEVTEGGAQVRLRIVPSTPRGARSLIAGRIAPAGEFACTDWTIRSRRTDGRRGENPEANAIVTFIDRTDSGDSRIVPRPGPESEPP